MILEKIHPKRQIWLNWQYWQNWHYILLNHTSDTAWIICKKEKSWNCNKTYGTSPWYTFICSDIGKYQPPLIRQLFIEFLRWTIKEPNIYYVSEFTKSALSYKYVENNAPENDMQNCLRSIHCALNNIILYIQGYMQTMTVPIISISCTTYTILYTEHMRM